MRAFPLGPDALSRVLTRLTECWPQRRVGQRDLGEAGRMATRSLLCARIGVLFEIWLPLRRRRSGSRAACLRDRTEVAVTSKARTAGPESRAVLELGEGMVEEGRLSSEGLISAPSQRPTPAYSAAGSPAAH